MAAYLEVDANSNAFQVFRPDLGSPTIKTDAALQNTTGLTQVYVLSNNSGAAAYYKISNSTTGASAAGTSDWPVADSQKETIAVGVGDFINVKGTMRILRHREI